MPSSLGDWLPLLRAHLDERLVSTAAFDRIAGLAGHLPGACLGVFEVRLADDSGVVDLSVRVQEREHAAILANRVGPPHVATLLERWSRSVPDLAAIRSIWLELDLDQTPGSRLEPVVCVELDRGFEPAWILDTLVPALDGASPSASRRANLRRIVSAAPRLEDLLYVFGLGARGLDATRFEFHRVTPRTLRAWHETLEARDTAGRLDPLLLVLADADRYHFSFDIGEEILPRLGLEASFRRLPHREPGWRGMLDRMVSRGLCTAAKREAVLAWPGWDSVKTASGAWPAAARSAGFMARCLSHFKLVSTPEAEPEAKAYLLFSPVSTT